MKISRRIVLKGFGGVVLSLPFLEGLAPRGASAATDTPPFAIFFRQANGVAQAQSNDEIGDEPERFWPRDVGALTDASMMDRATGELVAHRSKLLMVRNVNMEGFDYGDGHARGAMQGLTARGPVVDGAAGNSEADGESLNHRIGAELNEGGRESLFMYAGRNSGWLGGACISYRGSNNRRSALNNPSNAYMQIMGGDTGMSPAGQVELVERQRSVNDLVRDQLTSIMGRPELSTADHQRLQLHLDSIRDTEVALSCNLAEDDARMLEGMSPGFDSTDGNDTLRTARLHMEVVALAVACGYTRSAAIQVGSGNDGATRYQNLATGEPMENYHYISHRRLSHDSNGGVIAGSDLLHHYVDMQFAQTFLHLLNRLDAYSMPSGGTLLDCGVSVWYNDNSNGPPHGRNNVPYVIAGGAGGFLKQGQVVEVDAGDRNPNHSKMLNTLGSAAGLQNGGGGNLDDFGDPGQPRGLLDELLA